MRVAVTGAAGRIGTKVVALLIERGHSVVAIDKNVPDGHDGDDGHDGGDTADRADGGGGGRAAHVRIGWRPTSLITTPYSAPSRVATPSSTWLPSRPGTGGGMGGAPQQCRFQLQRPARRRLARDRQICQASSVNAIGGAYSRKPRFDYFPLDEDHPSFNEDPYSLSKWICEQQAASIARRYDSLLIASLRLHMCVEDRDRALEAAAAKPETAARDLWGYTSLTSAAGACLLAIGAGYTGHEVFLIVAPDHVGPAPAMELAAAHYPDVPLRRARARRKGFSTVPRPKACSGGVTANGEPTIARAPAARTSVRALTFRSTGGGCLDVEDVPEPLPNKAASWSRRWRSGFAAPTGCSPTRPRSRSYRQAATAWSSGTSLWAASWTATPVPGSRRGIWWSAWYGAPTRSRARRRGRRARPVPEQWFHRRGIEARDGFGSERYRLAPGEAVRLDPDLGLAGVLLEPTSIVSKAWEKMDLRQRRRGRALVTGAGPIGLLAALLGVQRGYEVHVLDQVDQGRKPDQVRGLGATYHRPRPRWGEASTPCSSARAPCSAKPCARARRWARLSCRGGRRPLGDVLVPAS